MPVSYKKLLSRLENDGITSYVLTKKYKIIGTATWNKIKEGGHVDTRTISALCKFLDCQPGDIFEYVPDEE